MNCTYTTQGELVCGRKKNETIKEKFIDEPQNIPTGNMFDMSKFCEVKASKDPSTDATNYTFKECSKN